MYGITSIAFSHNEWFSNEQIPWQEEQVWPCTIEVPDGNDLPRELGAQLIDVAKLDVEAFGVYRSGANQINVYFPEFWNARQLFYKVDEQRLSLVSRALPVNHFLTGLHARAGYQHDSFKNDAWAFMVDLVMISFLLWVATGFYIWW